jgi:hypothetical protein
MQTHKMEGYAVQQRLDSDRAAFMLLFEPVFKRHKGQVSIPDFAELLINMGLITSLKQTAMLVKALKPQTQHSQQYVLLQDLTDCLRCDKFEQTCCEKLGYRFKKAFRDSFSAKLARNSAHSSAQAKTLC